MTSVERAARLVRIMRLAFPEATVERATHEALVPGMLNHPKDRHVLAATIAAGARTIITFNLRDFPVSALAPLGIEARSPDDFLGEFLISSPQLILATIEQQAADLIAPPLTIDDVLDALERHAPVFVRRVRQLRAG